MLTKNQLVRRTSVPCAYFLAYQMRAFFVTEKTKTSQNCINKCIDGTTSTAKTSTATATTAVLVLLIAVRIIRSASTADAVPCHRLACCRSAYRQAAAESRDGSTTLL